LFISRDKLPAVAENGYMFGGTGYVILNKERFRPDTMSSIKLSFKTFAEEGLIFLIGIPNKDFLSLEIRNGQIVYQYELGSGRVSLRSTQTYNDGKWHVITASRLNQDGMLKVDGQTGMYYY